MTKILSNEEYLKKMERLKNSQKGSLSIENAQLSFEFDIGELQYAENESVKVERRGNVVIATANGKRRIAGCAHDAISKCFGIYD